jgi:ribosomal protein S18 acetylase RimI-like enzyme
MLKIDELDADAALLALPSLAEVLHACVLDGASVGFVLPFAPAEALGFWQDLMPAFRSGARRLLVARWDDAIVGTVQVVVGMLPNGRHRAEISKLLVHPAARRRGIARALMVEAEDLARRHDRSLLVLDTRAGDPAQSLYASLGFALTGIVPAYALSIAGVPEACSFMHKILPPA